MQRLSHDQQQLQAALQANHNSLVTTTYLRLARLARARGVEPQAIDDVVQETLLEAWRHMDRLFAPAGFSAWIDEICRNICRRAARRGMLDRRRTQSLSQSAASPDNTADDGSFAWLAADTPDPLDAFDRHDLECLLDRALGLLSAETRQLVELCYVRELPHAQAAALLGISSGTLDVRLHRARRKLRDLLHGPLREEAEALGLPLDAELAAGWRASRIWCPRCASHRLESCFVTPKPGATPNLHVRCPDCSRRYNQDTVHSMGLVRLTHTRAFRPAWKRTMQTLAGHIIQALQRGQHPCLRCGRPAVIRVVGEDSAIHGATAAWRIQIQCFHCDTTLDGLGQLPSVDQVAAWADPYARQFLLAHSRTKSEPGQLIEHAGMAALRFQLADLETNARLTLVVERQTLRILACEP